MADEPENVAEENQAAPKKSKMMLFIIIGVLLVALGGGGFFAYSTFMKPAPATAVDGAAPPPPTKEVKIIGEIFSLAPFTVNLADPKGKRYLKVRIEVEFDNETDIEKATKATPKLRDMVIMMLTSLSFEEVMTPEGKLRIRDELLERFNQVMRPIKVKNIYFTEFVVQ